MKIVYTLLLSLMSFHLMAQIPQAFQYQAVVRDGTGNHLPNANVQFQISIENHDGTVVYYREQQTTTSNALGGINLVIGKGTLVTGNFQNIDWSSGNVRVKVEMDPSGGQNFLHFGTTQLQSVPFSLYADKAESLIDQNGNAWFPEDDRDEQTLTVNGNQLSITNGNAVTLPSGSGGGDDWGDQTIESNATLEGDGTLSFPLRIASQGAVNGEVLKWNGNAWMPDTDNGNTYEAGNGIIISGNIITNDGDEDDDPANEIQSLSLNGNTLSLTNGGSVNLPTLTEGTGIDINGNTINALNTQALWNATQLEGREISNAIPTAGKVLKYDGSAWIPDTDIGQNYVEGVGIDITGNTVSANHTSAIWNASELNGNNISNIAPTTGDVLKWNGSAWRPDDELWLATGNEIYFPNNVGIGITNPESKLHIPSDDHIQMGDQTMGKILTVSVAFSGNVAPQVDDQRSLGFSTRRWTSVWATDGTINTSDSRQKTNIQNIDYGLDAILQLRPVQFQWINRPEKGNKLGLLAQEVENIIPEVVANVKRTPSIAGEPEELNADILGMYYSDLIPVLIKAIQEQNEKLIQLEQEIIALKNR